MVSVNETRTDLPAPDIPAALWQIIYSRMDSQQEVCSGMRVCKTLHAALTDVLRMAVVNESSWGQVPAISQRFLKLTSLRLKAAVPADVPENRHKVLGQPVPLSTLTFPSLVTITLPNFAASSLILTAANYPKLETLFVERLDFQSYPMTVKLQIPTLHTLSINGIVTNSLWLADSLCTPNCPSLNSVDLQSVSFKPLARGEIRRDVALFCMLSKRLSPAHHPPWLLEMPACRSLGLTWVDTPCIYLHAPKLCHLDVTNCDALNAQQDFFTLMPDVFAAPETPLAERRRVTTRSTSATAAAATAAAAAAAAATAAAAAATTAEPAGAALPGSSTINSNAGAASTSDGGGSSTARARYLAGGRHVPGDLHRLLVSHSNMESWVNTPSYHALCRDPRVKIVLDTEEDAGPNWFDMIDDDAEEWAGEWNNE